MTITTKLTTKKMTPKLREPSSFAAGSDVNQPMPAARLNIDTNALSNLQ